MGLGDWNWKHPVELQDVPWDCAAASLSWCLQACGRDVSEADVVAGLGPARISPALGLLDASGAGLVEYLAEIGVGAENNPDATWEDVQAAAGSQPMLIGGREWCHWTGVRLPTFWGYKGYEPQLALANPAPGYMGVGQVLYHQDFDRLGAFSAVWFTSW
jgi:hypothetical protein